MVNHKSFDKPIVPKTSYMPIDFTNKMGLKPAPNAMKIYNDFKQDQHETFYYTHNK